MSPVPLRGAHRVNARYFSVAGQFHTPCRCRIVTGKRRDSTKLFGIWGCFSLTCRVKISVKQGVTNFSKCKTIRKDRITGEGGNSYAFQRFLNPYAFLGSITFTPLKVSFFFRFKMLAQCISMIIKKMYCSEF